MMKTDERADHSSSAELPLTKSSPVSETRLPTSPPEQASSGRDYPAAMPRETNAAGAVLRTIIRAGSAARVVEAVLIAIVLAVAAHVEGKIDARVTGLESDLRELSKAKVTAEANVRELTEARQTAEKDRQQIIEEYRQLRKMPTGLRHAVRESYEESARESGTTATSPIAATDSGLMATEVGGLRARGGPFGKRSGCAA